jgi:hypothetical protein
MALACGDGHTVIVLEDGWAACSTGTGVRGRLGHGDTQPRERPARLAASELWGRVILVAAGSDHSAAITCDGSLHTWSVTWRVLCMGLYCVLALTPTATSSGEAGSKARSGKGAHRRSSCPHSWGWKFLAGRP